jgi:hypothetical protein
MLQAERYQYGAAPTISIYRNSTSHITAGWIKIKSEMFV